MTLDPDEILARIDGTLPVVQTDKNAHLWARHPEDYYTEPEWCSERLFATEHFEGTIVDPSCGSGRIVLAARAHREKAQKIGDHHITKALGYDIVKRSKVCNEDLEDFLTSDYETDNIVSNPPFGCCGLKDSKEGKRLGLTEDFQYVKKALATAEKKVALLLPLPWISGAEKGKFLATTPLAKVLIITPRPSMPPGPVIEAGLAPGGGTEDFAWMIWDRTHKGPPTLGWLNRDA
jgi:predicted RNA methylase